MGIGGLWPPPQRWSCEQGEHARLRGGGTAAVVPGYLGCQEQGWLFSLALCSGQALASIPRQGPGPWGSALPACTTLSFVIIFIMIVICPPVGSVSVQRGGGGERSPAPSLQGWLLLWLHGREAMFQRSAPSLGCLTGSLPAQPSGQEGGLPDPRVSGPRMDVPGQGTALCHFPPLCGAGAVHPPLSRGRAVPHASCDRCTRRGTAGSALWRGGQAAPVCVGSGSETAPGAAWHLGVHKGVL